MKCINFVNGELAQLVEHLLCKQGVIGSSPIFSTAPDRYVVLYSRTSYVVCLAMFRCAVLVSALYTFGCVYVCVTIPLYDYSCLSSLHGFTYPHHNATDRW